MSSRSQLAETLLAVYTVRELGEIMHKINDEQLTRDLARFLARLTFLRDERKNV